MNSSPNRRIADRTLTVLVGLVVVLGLPFVMAWDLVEQLTRRLRGSA